MVRFSLNVICMRVQSRVTVSFLFGVYSAAGITEFSISYALNTCIPKYRYRIGFCRIHKNSFSFSFFLYQETNRILFTILCAHTEPHCKFIVSMLSNPYLFNNKPVRNACQPPVRRKILLDLPPPSTLADPLVCNLTGYARFRYLILTRRSECRNFLPHKHAIRSLPNIAFSFHLSAIWS